MDTKAMDRAVQGHDTLHRALIFVFFMLGSTVGTELLSTVYSGRLPVFIYTLAFSVLLCLGIVFSFSLLGSALLPVCAMADGVVAGHFAEFSVQEYLSCAVLDYWTLAACVALVSAFFCVAVFGMCSSAMLIDAVGKNAREERNGLGKGLAVLLLFSFFAIIFSYFAVRRPI